MTFLAFNPGPRLIMLTCAVNVYIFFQNVFENKKSTRWVALRIQLGKFVGGGVADNNYLYPARWGWINILFQFTLLVLQRPKYWQSVYPTYYLLVLSNVLNW